MTETNALNLLVDEKAKLASRLDQEREQLDALRQIAIGVEEQIIGLEQRLADINEVLGLDPQLRLDDSDVRLRGQRLEHVAISVLQDALQHDNETIHYREWFDLIRDRGYLVAGKQPLNTFLAQINRAKNVERVGKRTGIYRIAS